MNPLNIIQQIEQVLTTADDINTDAAKLHVLIELASCMPDNIASVLIDCFNRIEDSNESV